MSQREVKMCFQILFESLSSIKKNSLDFLMRSVLSFEMRYCASVHEIRHLHATNHKKKLGKVLGPVYMEVGDPS